MKEEMFQGNAILRLSFEFSLSVIEYCDRLNAEKKFVLSNQLLRSGTSVGANAMEAQNAESKADFIHKMKIAAKEAGEAQYWLMLCKFSSSYPDCDALLIKLEEINKVLNSILKTSKRKNPFSYLLSYFIL
ncbi:MAG: four helix bundle protein [Rhizobacter sp.]|nr:four helix bundle protein [Ferruginibacter sp.]